MPIYKLGEIVQYQNERVAILQSEVADRGVIYEIELPLKEGQINTDTKWVKETDLSL